MSRSACTCHESCVLACARACLQPVLPYRIANLESNDVLYNGSDDYIEELSELLNEIASAVVAQLKELGAAGVPAPVEARLNLAFAEEALRCIQFTDATIPLVVDALKAVKRLGPWLLNLVSLWARLGRCLRARACHMVCADPGSKPLAALLQLLLAKAQSGQYPDIQALAATLRSS